MTAERNMSSVLAKLMNIDKPSISYATHQRHRVLSENYLQSIASVINRQKVLPLSVLDNSDSEMDVTEDFPCTSRTFIHARRSVSCSSSVVQKRRDSLTGRHNGNHFQMKRLSSSSNSKGSPSRSPLSSHDIAKQITSRLQHNIWQSCAESSNSKLRCERDSENIEDTMTSFAPSFESGEKQEASSLTPAKGHTRMETQKPENQLSERWKTRKCSEEVRWSCGRKIKDEVSVRNSGSSTSVTNTSDGNFHASLSSTNVNGCPILGARYLSKPKIFPNTWIPRSKSRHFTLDKSWSLKPGKMVDKQCIDSEKSKEVQSTSESCVSLEKPCSYQEASFIPDDSDCLAKESSCEEIFTPSGSSSSKSESSEKDDSQDTDFESFPSNCNLASPSLLTKELTEEGNKPITMSTKSRMANLSVDERIFKYQLKHKNNAREPRSPVSSLEGPEDYTHTLNLIVEAAEHLSISDCLENNGQGLHKNLQLIETISLESGSEGPEMVISSDEGDDRNALGFYQDDPQIIEIYQNYVKECWDYSYVVDVVAESGLEIRNLEMESKTSQGYVISPLVFESLEKKYGKSMPWEKCERRLLFDRLSSALLEIVRTSVGLDRWRQPVAKRFSPRDRNLELEEELWSIMVKQEQEVKKDSSDKVCRKEIEWLDLEEDTNLIVQEIESSLLDEMVEEFVSLEISFMFSFV